MNRKRQIGTGAHRPLGSLSQTRRLLRQLYEPFFRLSKSMSRKGLYPFLSAQFEGIQKDRKVLSVGAGGEVNRLLQRVAKQQGFQVIQLDINPRLYPDIVADICEWSSPNAFDAAIASEVLEHCHRPRAAVQNIRTSLINGGHLVVTVPFVFPIHDAPVDYFRYTRHGLRLLFDDFEDVVIKERNNWGESLAVLLARCVKPNRRGLKAVSPILVCLAALLYPPLWAAGKLFPSRFLTTGYNVQARKPL